MRDYALCTPRECIYTPVAFALTMLLTAYSEFPKFRMAKNKASVTPLLCSVVALDVLQRRKDRKKRQRKAIPLNKTPHKPK
jgi:hypothetical protein